MNRLLAVFAAAPMALVAPYAAASVAVHPAQAQMQQNMDTVLKIARNKSLSEPQKVKQIESYANRYIDYQRISALAVAHVYAEAENRIYRRV